MPVLPDVGSTIVPPDMAAVPFCRFDHGKANAVLH